MQQLKIGARYVTLILWRYYDIIFISSASAHFHTTSEKTILLW